MTEEIKKQYEDAARKILDFSQGIGDLFDREQDYFYDKLAQGGGWENARHMEANENEISVFAKYLFDKHCVENGYEPFFKKM